MEKKLQPKHLPTSLAIISLLLAIIAGVYFLNYRQSFFPKASSDTAPQQIKITNITHSSFVVSWLTTEKATGSISYGETNDLDMIKMDQLGTKLHFVKIDGLKPQTKYYFQITSGGKNYLDGQKPFEVTTASQKVPLDNDIAQGQILTAEEEPAKGVIVYLSLANTLTQTAVTDSNGNWMIPLSTARNLDLQNFSEYDRTAQIMEIVVKGENLTSKATLTTGGDNPTPTIILGQNYDFLSQMPDLSPTPTTDEIGRGGFPATQQDIPSPQTGLSIIFPSEDEKVNNTIPEFLGTGPANEILEIKVESEEEVSDQTTVDSNGSWKWFPPTSLSPGEHTITVTYTNKEGVVEKISRSFTVLAAGESNLPSFTATPSGQTVTPSPSPTPTIKPDQESLPSTESGVPITGINIPTKFFFGAGITTLVLAGLLLLI